MDGKTFECYLEAVFINKGYAVERTPYVGDRGADLVLRKDGQRIIVQAKRRNGQVGPAAIGDVLRARASYGCFTAMIVTNGSLTRQAAEEARINGIEVW